MKLHFSLHSIAKFSNPLQRLVPFVKLLSCHFSDSTVDACLALLVSFYLPHLKEK